MPPGSVGDPRVGDSTIPNERRHRWNGTSGSMCTQRAAQLAVISQAGKRLKDFPVETNGQALVEAVRMIPGEKHLVFEEGLQSAWLYETLCPHVAEIVAAGITESRGQKSDKRDAYGLAEKLRSGTLGRVGPHPHKAGTTRGPTTARTSSPDSTLAEA